MDMMLPGVTGLDATEYIMAHCPTPILVVSASFNRGEVLNTYDALAAGAVDVIEKPSGTEPPGVWERDFRRALKIVSRVRVITHLRARLSGATKELPAPASSHRAPLSRVPSAPPGSDAQGRPRSVLAIGASTGGPSALVQVLGALPRELTSPALVVLHIGSAFAFAFADWLGAQLARPVAYAQGGEVVAALRGRVVLAPPDRHMVVRGGRLALIDTPERHSCRPSVDVLFESVASELGGDAAGCLLTGMGRDGAAGLLALRRAGAATVAQDEATSVIYGMPREAAILNAAERILPLGEIGAALGALARGTKVGAP
jgi:two-component system chemotaxis response regulator CheB